MSKVKITNTGDSLVRVISTNIAPGHSVEIDQAEYLAWRQSDTDHFQLSIDSLLVEAIVDDGDPIKEYQEAESVEVVDEAESEAEDPPQPIKRRTRKTKTNGN